MLCRQNLNARRRRGRMRNNKLVDITTNALSPHHTKFHLTENFYCGSPASRAHGNISSQMKFATLHGAMCYIRHGFAVPPSPLDRRSQWNLNRRSQCIEGKAWLRIKISCQHNVGRSNWHRHNKDKAKLHSDHQNATSRQPLPAGVSPVLSCRCTIRSTDPFAQAMNCGRRVR